MKTASLTARAAVVSLALLFSFLGIIALFTGMFSSGMLSVYAFTSVGLFCSTLWPCIFTLAIAGLGWAALKAVRRGRAHGGKAVARRSSTDAIPGVEAA